MSLGSKDPYDCCFLGPYTKEAYKKNAIDLIIFRVTKNKVYKLKYELYGQTHIERKSIDLMMVHILPS